MHVHACMYMHMYRELIAKLFLQEKINHMDKKNLKIHSVERDTS